MFKSSTALLLALALCAPIAQAQEAKPLQIQADAPDRYVVVKGDTLWGISGKFLKDPWRWPEVWGMNKEQIANPHLIYPGDVIVFNRNTMTLSVTRGEAGANAAAAAASDEPCVRAVGTPTQVSLRNGKLVPCIREQALAAEAISTIPAQVIEPFLSKPLITDGSSFRVAPRIVGTQEGRVNLGLGNLAYASGITDEDPDTWYVYRNGAVLVDPETEEPLGTEAVFLGTARVTKTGEPTTLRITTSKREISVGDRLLAAPPPKIFNYAPHSPAQAVRGRVVSIYDGETDTRGTYYKGQEDPDLKSNYGNYHETGPLSIIAINKGTKDGIDVGTVLAINRAIVVPNDRSIGKWLMGEKRPKEVTLPEERFGLIMVFRTFETISYALVVQAERAVSRNDVVVNP